MLYNYKFRLSDIPMYLLLLVEVFLVAWLCDKYDIPNWIGAVGGVVGMVLIAAPFVYWDIQREKKEGKDPYNDTTGWNP